MANMTLIETKTVGAGGSSNIEFTGLGSYSSTYTDLYLVCSLRTNAAFTGDNLAIEFNGLGSSNFTAKNIYNTTTGTPASQNFTTIGEIAGINGTGTTSNVFSNTTVYIPNFSSSNYKSISTESAVENNASRGDGSLYSTLWSNTAAITSLKLLSSAGASFVQYSSVSLYGVSKVTSTPKATGGIVSQDATYWYHTFPFTSTFTPTTALSADILVVAGGGGGAKENGTGGGGAGGLLAFTNQSLSTTAYTVTVGAGGTGATSNTSNGNTGGDSQFGALTLVKGGGYSNSGNGGSGGGAYPGSTGGSATSGQGNAGGNGIIPFASPYPSGGGGGAGAAGQNGSGTQSGAGGIGVNTYSSWASATFTGHNGYYAGGGGGGTTSQGAFLGAGGLGGGAEGGPNNGMANTGGGGGGGLGANSSNGGSGGSGLVIVRYAK
jgi:hypothetical protein